MLNQEIAVALDRFYGPVVTTFEITRVPDGGAPFLIRQDWIGAELPVRQLHASRLQYGYIGRRFMPLSEDTANDALTSEKPKWPVWGNVEIRGYDAIESLRRLGRLAAVEFWTPYEEAMLGFELYTGRFAAEPVASEMKSSPDTPRQPKAPVLRGRLIENIQLPE